MKKSDKLQLTTTQLKVYKDALKTKKYQVNYSKAPRKSFSKKPK